MQIALWPLLKKKVIISNLTVTNPEVKLIQDSKGKTNLKEVVSAAFTRSFRENMGSFIMNMPRGIGQNAQNIGANLGGWLKKTGEGLTNLLKKLFRKK